MPNIVQVTVTAGVPTAGTGTVSTLDNLIGVAGTPSPQVLTVQGAAGGTGLPVTGAVTATLAAETTKVIGTVNLSAAQTLGTVTTVSAVTAITNALPAGTNLLGKVGIDQTTPGTTNLVSIGTNGTVNPQTAANWGIGTSTQNSASVANGHLGLAQFNTTPTTVTTGNMSPLQMDANGNLLVNIKAGAGSGGTAIADEAAFTAGTTSTTPVSGLYQTTATSNPATTGQAAAAQITINRALHTNLRNAVGVEVGSPASPLSARLTDGTNPVTVKAASTAPVTATDAAIVTVLRPDSAGIIATGTAGSPSATVLSMQGVVGGTPLPNLPTLTAAANGLTKSRVNAAASTNATSLKASAGNIGEIDLFNNSAYTVYFKWYDKASPPTVGTDTPVWTIPIAAGGGYSKSFSRGKTLATGIAYAITKLQADTDTTVVVAGDLTGSIDWI